jgi:hypothetical protein
LIGGCLVAIAALVWMNRLSAYTIIGTWYPNQKALRGAVFRENVGQTRRGCIPPPENFKESDLIGVWEREFGTPGNTTLILREDRTYKQIYDDPDLGYHYESDWQGWRVEYRESGIPNLHLEGMRLCDYSSDDCEREDGGATEFWIDYCEARPVEMRGEVVLLILGVSSDRVKPPHRDIVLSYPVPDPDSIPRAFQLQE